MALFSAKNAGLAFMIAAILSIIDAAIAVYIGRDYITPYIVLAVGSVICALLYFVYGNKVRTGVISDKPQILAEYVKIVGIVTIIGAVFAAIFAYMLTGSLGASLTGLLVGIIFGVIILIMAMKINDGKQTTGDKLIWIILLIAFVILLLASILEIISGIVTITGIFSGICHLIIYSFMILLLIDEDVKSAMGI